jgi:hypothetical protein
MVTQCHAPSHSPLLLRILDKLEDSLPFLVLVKDVMQFTLTWLMELSIGVYERYRFLLEQWHSRCPATMRARQVYDKFSHLPGRIGSSDAKADLPN